MTQLSLDGKQVILVCPDFYGYENIIKEELTQCGAKVDIIYENVEWIYLHFQIIYKCFPRQKEKALLKYYKKHLKNIEKCDYFFVVRGTSLTVKIMDYVKSKAPERCKFIMYQWDSVARDARLINVINYFDSIATFDPIDAEHYRWHYRPLFYIDKLLKVKTDRKYDVLYICSAHSQRIQVLRKLKQIVEERHLKLKAILHMNILVYLKHKYTRHGVCEINDIIAKKEDIALHALKLADCYELYGDSKIVVDYTHPSQNGLTMRTIESLGSGCKLITNNKRIREADFYNENNVYVYNDCELNIPESFFHTPYSPVSEEICSKYSIHEWLSELIGMQTV